MENSINKRIKQLIKLFAGGKSSKFAHSLEVTPGQLTNYTGERQSKPGFDILAKICEVYPQLNERWLLLGQGDIFKSLDSNNLSGNNNEDSTHFQLQANNSALEKSFNRNTDSFKISEPESNLKTELELIKKEVESLRRQLESKDEIIRSKEETIRSKEEIIRSKEETIQSKEDIINHLKNRSM